MLKKKKKEMIIITTNRTTHQYHEYLNIPALQINRHKFPLSLHERGTCVYIDVLCVDHLVFL